MSNNAFHRHDRLRRVRPVATKDPALPLDHRLAVPEVLGTAAQVSSLAIASLYGIVDAMKALTVRQAADLIKRGGDGRPVSRRWIHYLIRRERLKATKFGRDWSIDAESVRQYCAIPHRPGRPKGTQAKGTRGKRLMLKAPKDQAM